MSFEWLLTWVKINDKILQCNYTKIRSYTIDDRQNDKKYHYFNHRVLYQLALESKYKLQRESMPNSLMWASSGDSSWPSETSTVQTRHYSSKSVRRQLERARNTHTHTHSRWHWKTLYNNEYVLFSLDWHASRSVSKHFPLNQDLCAICH